MDIATQVQRAGVGWAPGDGGLRSEIPREDAFCPECGQPLKQRAPAIASKDGPSLWWSSGLLALGALLSVLFGQTAWSAENERSATEAILSGLPAWETRLEGPSGQQAALQSEAPVGVVDRYRAAQRELSRAVPDLGFAVATLLLGVSLLVRRSVQRRMVSYTAARGADHPAAPLASVLRFMLNAWAIAETVTLAGFRLIAITFLYLLSTRIVGGESMRGEILPETLDRVLQFALQLPELLRSLP